MQELFTVRKNIEEEIITNDYKNLVFHIRTKIQFFFSSSSYRAVRPNKKE